MGTSQLVAVVLGIIIVGLGMVLGFAALGEASTDAERNAITAELAGIAQKAENWRVTPVAMRIDNAGKAGSFEDIQTSYILPNVDETTGEYINAAGYKFKVTGAADSMAVISGTGVSLGDNGTTPLRYDVTVKRSGPVFDRAN